MKPFLIILPLAILAGGWFYHSTNNTQDQQPSDIRAPVVDVVSPQTDQMPNPLATTSPQQETPIPSQEWGTETPVVSNTPTELPPRPVRDDIDLTTLAATPLTDEEFSDLENRIRRDPSLLTDILAEYRYNTDPERAKRLAALIGKLKDPKILATATELAYSSDPQSKKNGLELLSRIQPHNSEARDISIELLGIESDPDFLVSTMNVLATPGTNASDAQKQLLLDNMALLSTHQEESVRAHSIALLGRWAKDDLAVTNTLTAALSDSSAHVRARAASALNGTGNSSDQVIYGLLAVLENPDEVKTTRQTAMLALQRLSLPQSLQNRFLAGQLAIRTRQITQ